MSLSTIDAIVAMNPQAKITIIAGQAPASLLATNPWKASVDGFDAAWQKVVRQLGGENPATTAKRDFVALLQQRQPDMAILFHPDITANQLVRQANIPVTLGFTNAGGGFNLSHPIDMPSQGHQVARNFALAETYAKLFNRPLPPLQPPKLLVDPHDTIDIENLLKQKGAKPNIAVLHPFASAVTKNWPIDRWQTVIAGLIKRDVTPIIIGSKQDHFPDAESGEVLDFCGQLTLPQTAALLQRATVFIGIDSGPGHIAAAVGTPTVSIFSDVNDPERWQPYGQKTKLRVLHKDVTDQAHFPREMRDLPPGTVGNPYSDRISPEEVLHTVASLVD